MKDPWPPAPLVDGLALPATVLADVTSGVEGPKGERLPATPCYDVAVDPDPEITVFVTHDKDLYPFRTPESMRWVLDEIMGRMEYAVLGLPSWTPTVIVDIGANAGAFALYAALHWRSARIVAFEPVAKSYALLEHNLADFAKVETVRAALLDRDGEARIHYGRHNPGEASLMRGDNQSDDGEVVALRRAASELERLAIDRISVLKIDTEGSELPILQDLAPWLPRTDFVLLEYHSAADRLAIDVLLGDHFVVFGGKVMDLDTGVMKYVRRDLVGRTTGPSALAAR